MDDNGQNHESFEPSEQRLPPQHPSQPQEGPAPSPVSQQGPSPQQPQQPPPTQPGAGWWAAQSPAGQRGPVPPPAGATPGPGTWRGPYSGVPYGTPPGGSSTQATPQTSQTLPPAGGDPGRPRRKKLYTGIGATALVAAIIGGGIGLGGGYLIAGNGGSGAPTIVSQQSGTSTVSTKPGSVQYAAEVAGKSTVDIKVVAGRTGDEGTGIVLSSNGYVLTNHHVVALAENGGQIQVTLPGGKKANAKIIGTAPSYDLAVIKVNDASGLTPAQFGQSSSVKVGQPVAAIGSPFGYANTVTSGIVSALHRTIAYQGDNGQAVVYTGLQTDAPINPGNSGGPLVNMSGQVIGVNSSISTGDSQSSNGSQGGSIGIGFSIPVHIAQRVANDLMHQGYTTKPVLGVTGKLSGTSGGNGAQVDSVQAGSGAANAGLKAGDVITKVNNDPIGDYADLMARILEYSPGQQIALTVQSQGGGTKTLHATLGSTKDQTKTVVPDQGGSPFGFGGGGINPFSGSGGH